MRVATGLRSSRFTSENISINAIWIAPAARPLMHVQPQTMRCESAVSLFTDDPIAVKAMLLITRNVLSEVGSSALTAVHDRSEMRTCAPLFARNAFADVDCADQ